jgi:hypothetical protein
LYRGRQGTFARSALISGVEHVTDAHGSGCKSLITCVTDNPRLSFLPVGAAGKRHVPRLVAFHCFNVARDWLGAEACAQATWGKTQGRDKAPQGAVHHVCAYGASFRISASCPMISRRSSSKQTWLCVKESVSVPWPCDAMYEIFPPGFSGDMQSPSTQPLGATGQSQASDSRSDETVVSTLEASVCHA